MKFWRGLVAVSSLILLTGTAQCGSTSDAPQAQVLLWVDTDAPTASLALVQEGDAGAVDDLLHDPHLLDAAVDTLRIDILKPDNTIADLREISAPDETNWPISFGVQSQPGVNVIRLRLRAFRAQRAQLGPHPLDSGEQVFEPVPAYAIDRVVEIPLPSGKGSVGYRVVLRSPCRGDRPDFVQGDTCVWGTHSKDGYREGIQVADPSVAPAREPMWWPASDDLGCTDVDHVRCIPGGFFMLGNIRVVGFRSLRRHDAVPPHPVAMQPFRMDELEMSIERWNKLGVSAPNYDPTVDANCTWQLDPMTKAVIPAGALPATTPMNCVPWVDAQNACKQANGRLPTEAEWEYVATGRGRGNLFPWGDAPPHCATSILGRFDKFGVAQCNGEDGDPGAIGQPGAHTHDQTDGVMDLAGSLSEWMLDTFMPYDQDCWRHEGVLSHPSCQLASHTTRSVRGGNFASPMEVSYAALRDSEEELSASSSIGFRCVYPIGPDPVNVLDPVDPGTPDSTEPADGGSP